MNRALGLVGWMMLTACSLLWVVAWVVHRGEVRREEAVAAAMSRHPSAAPWWTPADLPLRPVGRCDCGAWLVDEECAAVFSADGFTHSAAGCVETESGVL